MKQAAFEELHGPSWRRLEILLQELELRGKPPYEELVEFTPLFRKVCHFHALAKKRNYSSFLVDKLEDLVVRSHQQVYRRHHAFLPTLLRFIVRDFPAVVRQELKFVWASTALFVAPFVILLVSCLYAPEMVYTVLSPDQASNMESMYDPSNDVVGSARDAETNLMMFGFYIKNNISVAFRTFATGLALGVGSGFFLVYNGALFGAVAAHLVTAGFQTTFFTFVIAHGSFELTAIVLAGAAGLKLGYSILAPGQLTRVESLRIASRQAILIVYGVIVMLVIAAFIEAFWSSNNALSPTHKYVVGALLWGLVLFYFFTNRGSQYAPSKKDHTEL